MKIRSILASTTVGVAVLLAAVAPSLASPAPVSTLVELDGSPAISASATTSPVSTPSSPVTTPPGSPSATTSPATTPSCDATCQATCKADVACQIRWTIVIGGECTTVGQQTTTGKGEKCTCRKTGNAATWVKGDSTEAASLPVTGASTSIIAVVGAGLLMIGAVAFLLARRRRVRFSA